MTTDTNAPSPPAATQPSAEAGGILTIDLGAIVENWRALSRLAMPAECSAVIKADGYGCGLAPVAKALAAAGCKTFFVADLAEARRARAAAPDAAIYVLNGLAPGSGDTFAELSVSPCISSLLELAEWDAFVAQNGWRGGFALHIDTGMNRLGLDPTEAAAVASRIRLEHHGIALVMSHLACADVPDHPLNAKQVSLFRDMRLLYRGIPASLANSSGIFLGGPAHCDLVRPGAALYGVNPTPGRDNPMLPVVTLRARILQVRSVGRGETVGYGADWSAKRGARVAVVSVGYADGFPRSAGIAAEHRGKDKVAEALIGGTLCPLAGRVSMDLMAFDVSELPDNAVSRGDYATLIGDSISVDHVADAARTIGYEILTSLGPRYHRILREPDADATA